MDIIGLDLHTRESQRSIAENTVASPQTRWLPNVASERMNGWSCWRPAVSVKASAPLALCRASRSYLKISPIAARTGA